MASYIFTEGTNIVTASNIKSLRSIDLGDTIWADGDKGLSHGAKVIGIDENNLQITLDRNYSGTKVNTTTEIQKSVTSSVSFTITASKTRGAVPLHIDFDWATDQQGIEADAWLWDFGDGFISDKESPRHTYTFDGEYKVKCKIWFLNSSSPSTSKNEITIIVSEPLSPPDTRFSANKTKGNNPLTVQFYDESIGDIDLWEWDFGDGNTSSVSNPEHTYTSEGTYTVSLKTSGSSGTDEMIRTDYITVYATGSTPECDFTANIKEVEQDKSVTFTDKSTGDIISWLWDFGDGATATGQNPSHVYTKIGKFTVTLTVTDSLSQSDTEKKLDYIKVIEQIDPSKPIEQNIIPVRHQMIRLGNLTITKA